MNMISVIVRTHISTVKHRMLAIKQRRRHLTYLTQTKVFIQTRRFTSLGASALKVQIRSPMMTPVDPPLKTFLETPGNPPVPWNKWIEIFQKHQTTQHLSEEEKADLLLSLLGHEGLRVLRSLPGPTGTFTEMVAALSYHCHNEIKKTRMKTAVLASAIGGGVLVGVGAVVAAPFVLAGIGFTSAGIAAGSIAASMMSSVAIANGGAVAAGSLVAVLQSVGAVGLGLGASAAVAGTGAVAGGAIGGGIGALSAKLTEKRKLEDDEKDNPKANDEETRETTAKS